MTIPQPHTVTVYQATEQVTGLVVGATNYVEDSGVEDLCLIQPASIAEVYGKTGADLQGDYLLISLGDKQAVYTFNALVVWGSKKFKVAARPQAFLVGLPIDHTEVDLEEQQYAETPV